MLCGHILPFCYTSFTECTWMVFRADEWTLGGCWRRGACQAGQGPVRASADIEQTDRGAGWRASNYSTANMLCRKAFIPTELEIPIELGPGQRAKKLVLENLMPCNVGFVWRKIWPYFPRLHDTGVNRETGWLLPSFPICHNYMSGRIVRTNLLPALN